MSHANFEVLPLELRQRIAYYLSTDFRAGHPITICDKRSLVALAQAGRSGYEAATPFLWKTLFFHINWENPRRVDGAVDHCTRLLERNVGFQHVRSIQLLQYPDFSQSHLRVEDDDIYDDEDEGDDDGAMEIATIYSEIIGEVLQPLVALIQRIPSLAHFYFLEGERSPFQLVFFGFWKQIIHNASCGIMGHASGFVVHQYPQFSMKQLNLPYWRT